VNTYQYHNTTGPLVHFKLSVQHTEHSSFNYACSELEWCNQFATLVLQNRRGKKKIISDEGI